MKPATKETVLFVLLMIPLVAFYHFDYSFEGAALLYLSVIAYELAHE